MKSSFSGKLGNCIDVTERADDHRILIRETEAGYWNVNGRLIVTSKASFKAFIDGVKAGEFDHLVERD